MNNLEELLKKLDAEAKRMNAEVYSEGYRDAQGVGDILQKNLKDVQKILLEALGRSRYTMETTKDTAEEVAEEVKELKRSLAYTLEHPTNVVTNKD